MFDFRRQAWTIPYGVINVENCGWHRWLAEPQSCHPDSGAIGNLADVFCYAKPKHFLTSDDSKSTSKKSDQH
jgi:hypothetical protein